MTEKEKFLEEHGNQSYHKAVQFTVMANFLGDEEGAKLFAGLAIEFLQDGYHKFPREGET